MKKFKIKVLHLSLYLFTFTLGHGESTFRSGDVNAKKWLMEEYTPFHSKGRGCSFMVSDFLVCHPSGPCFSLSDIEIQQAIKTYPNLADENDIEYVKNTASAGVHVGSEMYFDNEAVLNQFERFFQMIRFKK